MNKKQFSRIALAILIFSLVILLSGCKSSKGASSISNASSEQMHIGNVTLEIPAGCAAVKLEDDRYLVKSGSKEQVITGFTSLSSGSIKNMGHAYSVLKPALAMLDEDKNNLAAYSSIHAVSGNFYLMSHADDILVENNGKQDISALGIIRENGLFYIVSLIPSGEDKRSNAIGNALAADLAIKTVGESTGKTIFSNTFETLDSPQSFTYMNRTENAMKEIEQYALDLSSEKVNNSVSGEYAGCAISALKLLNRSVPHEDLIEHDTVLADSKEIESSSSSEETPENEIPASGPEQDAENIDKTADNPQKYLLKSCDSGYHYIIGRDIEPGDYIGVVQSGSGSIVVKRNNKAAAVRLLGFGTADSIDRGSFGLLDGDEIILKSHDDMAFFLCSSNAEL